MGQSKIVLSYEIHHVEDPFLWKNIAENVRFIYSDKRHFLHVLLHSPSWLRTDLPNCVQKQPDIVHYRFMHTSFHLEVG